MQPTPPSQKLPSLSILEPYTYGDPVKVQGFSCCPLKMYIINKRVNTLTNNVLQIQLSIFQCEFGLFLLAVELSLAQNREDNNKDSLLNLWH